MRCEPIGVKLVLDTNIVLDWLVFDDPSIALIRDHVADGRMTILTHQRAVDELACVLARPELNLDTQGQAAALERYRALTTCVPLSEASLPKGFPRCSDPDDDHFLALAFHTQAQVLVSRDKALLALHRKSARFGFAIQTAAQIRTITAP